MFCVDSLKSLAVHPALNLTARIPTPGAAWRAAATFNDPDSPLYAYGFAARLIEQ
jgi:hypothetical protein